VSTPDFFDIKIGLGWDNMKNTVDAPDDWWKRKILACAK